MTEAASPNPASRLSGAEVRKIAKVDIGLKRRYAAERRFRAYGLLAVTVAICFLAALFGSIVAKGYTAFQQSMITIPVEFSEQVIDKNNERATNPQKLVSANYPVVARNALAKVLGVADDDRAGLKAVNGMISDMISMLESTVQRDLRAGRYPDRKHGHQMAEVLRAVARELDH